MSINVISQSNTFGELIVATAALIAVANNLVDGPQLVSNTTLIMTNPGVALNIGNTAIIYTANITILNLDTLNVNVATITTATINAATINVATINTATITTATIEASQTNVATINTATITTANVDVLTGNAVNQFDAAGLAMAMAIALG